MYKWGLLYYNIFTSSSYRVTRVYLHCDLSQTTPVATAIGEPDRILNYVSYKSWCTSYHLQCTRMLHNILNKSYVLGSALAISVHEEASVWADEVQPHLPHL